MRTIPLAIAGMLLSLLLAGCGDDPKVDGGDGLVDEGEFDGLDATSQTGLIRGVVVDEAIRPVAGVLVTLDLGSNQRNTTSAESGAFGFDGLEPGTYFLQVAKPGYKPVQQSADVLAGVADPPIVKVLLQADPETRPFFESFVFEGFIECSVRAVAYGVALCEDIGNDNVLSDIDLGSGIPTFAQGELVWESTQTLGDELSYNWRRDDTDSDYIDTEGPSPLMLQANRTLFEDNDVGAGQPLRTVIFTGHNPATEPPCAAGACLWGVGVQVQQKFVVYTHVFYNFVPAEGWRFTVDGEPQVPA